MHHLLFSQLAIENQTMAGYFVFFVFNNTKNRERRKSSASLISPLGPKEKHNMKNSASGQDLILIYWSGLHNQW